MKQPTTIAAFITLIGITCLFSCKKDPPVYACNIISETDTAISGLTAGDNYGISYQYDNFARLIKENNGIYTYGNGFVTAPDPIGGPPDTLYLNSSGYLFTEGGNTYIYDNEGHLIKEIYPGGYFLHTWQNGDHVSKIGYYDNGSTTGAEYLFTYYNNIPYQPTQPDYIKLGIPSAHMLQNEKDIYNYTVVLGNYSYTYSFDISGRVLSYKLYDSGDVWVTDLSYNCPY